MNDLKACPKCGWGMTLVEAGISKAGKQYPAFYSCKEFDGGCGYTENIDGIPSKKKPTPIVKKDVEIKEMFNTKQHGILASVALEWAVEWSKKHEEATTENVLKIADSFYKWLKDKAINEPF